MSTAADGVAKQSHPVNSSYQISAGRRKSTVFAGTRGTKNSDELQADIPASKFEAIARIERHNGQCPVATSAKKPSGRKNGMPCFAIRLPKETSGGSGLSGGPHDNIPDVDRGRLADREGNGFRDGAGGDRHGFHSSLAEFAHFRIRHG